MKKILSIISFALAGLICVAFAAEPPELINYQGVLRDSEGAPVEDGTYDMVFRFFDLESGGSLLLTDDHSGGDAVETSDGLFNVQLGSGTITPGTYGKLSDLFANESEVYLEVQVGTDAPMVPRMRIVTAAYALNADQLDGMNSDEFAKSSHTHAGTDITSPVAEATNADMVDSIHADATATPNYLYPLDANGKFPNSVLYSGSGSGLDADLLDGNDSTFFLDTSATAQTKVGPLTLDASGAHGIEAYGTVGGGYFEDKNSNAKAYLAEGDRGVWGYGEFCGGYFADWTDSGKAWAGYGDLGIEAWGNSAGGHFYDNDSSAEAYIARDQNGIEATGDSAGFGISASGGHAGGYFSDIGGSGEAWVGYGNVGVNAFGTAVGGEFRSDSARVLAANELRGIDAQGSESGGYFEDEYTLGWAYLGDSGGDGTSRESGNWGIQAFGYTGGGFFADAPHPNDRTAWAFVADDLGGRDSEQPGGGWGIAAFGYKGGGFFRDPIGGTGPIWTRIAYSKDGAGLQSNGTVTGNLDSGGYGFESNGSVSLLQNHPTEKDEVIRYFAPAGDEVATYTRGTARLTNGVARVALSKTFAMVTNPDIGLTAQLTPRGEPVLLAVESLTTEELVVQAPPEGPQEATFDYVVYGLRIGFENVSIVEEKFDDWSIPPLADRDALFERRPDLQEFSPLARFQSMLEESGRAGLLDLSQSEDLKTAIGVRRVGQPGPRPEPGGQTTRVAGALDGPHLPGAYEPCSADAIPIDEEGNIYGKSFRPSSTDVARYMPAGDELSAGDVVIIDRERPGFIVAAAAAADPGVIGIVAGEPGVLLGGSRPAEFEPAAGEEPGDGGEDAAAAVDAVAMAPTQVPVALSGIVLCKVDASYGPILPGDLLTTSPTRGHAMRAGDPLPGTVLGKALERLDKGAGLISVLVMLR